MQTRNSFALTEGQSVTFVLRTPLDEVQAVILEQCDKQERTQQCRIVGHRDGDKGILWSPRWSRYRLVVVDSLVLSHSFLFPFLWPVQTTIRHWYEWVIVIYRILEGIGLRTALVLEPWIFEQTQASKERPSLLKHHVAGAVVARPASILSEYICNVRNWCSPSSNT